MTLRVEADHSVSIEGYLEGEDLRFRHDGRELSEHGNVIDVVGVDQVRVLLRLPEAVTSVQHEGADGLVKWSRSGDGFEQTLVGATDPDEVEVAGDGGSPRATLHIKITPKGGLPDR